MLTQSHHTKEISFAKEISSPPVDEAELGFYRDLARQINAKAHERGATADELPEGAIDRMSLEELYRYCADKRERYL